MEIGRDTYRLVFKTSAFDRSATPPWPTMLAPEGTAASRDLSSTLARGPGEVAEWLKALAC